LGITKRSTLLTKITYKNTNYQIDLSKPLDISIPLRGEVSTINAWYVSPPKIEPHRNDKFIGSVAKGASTNFNDISFNPHAHVTHTECVGHITKELHSINQALYQFFFMAELITVAPEKQKNDFIISKRQIEYALDGKVPEALVIRTIPNTKSKKQRQYSNTNPPYLLKEAAEFIRNLGVKHLLIDLPSVDKEKDSGELLAHNAFWNTHDEIRLDATITEFIFVPNTINDGSYMLNLQVAPIENDASPSRPVLYKCIM
jgi:kynurenine formamidase